MARLTIAGLTRLNTIQARLDGVPVESVVRFGDPAEEILLEAESYGADLLALTAHDPGLLGLFVPGVAERVARKANVPVLLLRE